MRYLAGAVFIFVLALLAAGRPSAAFADPAGTQSQSVIPFQGSVFLSMTGFQGDAPLSIYFQIPGGNPFEVPAVSGYTASKEGTATVYLQPGQFMRPTYVGPVLIFVCDDQGRCLKFVINISTGHPLAVSSVSNLEYWCDLLGYILDGTRDPSVLDPLRELTPADLKQLMDRCSYPPRAQDRVLKKLRADDDD